MNEWFLWLKCVANNYAFIGKTIQFGILFKAICPYNYNERDDVSTHELHCFQRYNIATFVALGLIFNYVWELRKV